MNLDKSTMVVPLIWTLRDISTVTVFLDDANYANTLSQKRKINPQSGANTRSMSHLVSYTVEICPNDIDYPFDMESSFVKHRPIASRKNLPKISCHIKSRTIRLLCRRSAFDLIVEKLGNPRTEIPINGNEQISEGELFVYHFTHGKDCLVVESSAPESSSPVKIVVGKFDERVLGLSCLIEDWSKVLDRLAVTWLIGNLSLFEFSLPEGLGTLEAQEEMVDRIHKVLEDRIADPLYFGAMEKRYAHLYGNGTPKSIVNYIRHNISHPLHENFAEDVLNSLIERIRETPIKSHPDYELLEPKPFSQRSLVCQLSELFMEDTGFSGYAFITIADSIFNDTSLDFKTRSREAVWTLLKAPKEGTTGYDPSTKRDMAKYVKSYLLGDKEGEDVPVLGLKEPGKIDVSEESVLTLLDTIKYLLDK